jgi:hypothetical protein
MGCLGISQEQLDELESIRDMVEMKKDVLELQKGLQDVSLRLAQLTKYVVIKLAEKNTDKVFE